jgi:hypothetical protein
MAAPDASSVAAKMNGNLRFITSSLLLATPRLGQSPFLLPRPRKIHRRSKRNGFLVYQLGPERRASACRIPRRHALRQYRCGRAARLDSQLRITPVAGRQRPDRLADVGDRRLAASRRLAQKHPDVFNGPCCYGSGRNCRAGTPVARSVAERARICVRCPAAIGADPRGPLRQKVRNQRTGLNVGVDSVAIAAADEAR